MALAKHSTGRDIGDLRLLDRELHRLGIDIKTEAPMTVNHGRRRRFLHDAPLGSRHNMPDLDAIDVGGNRDHPVRVVAGKVGIDAADRDGIRLIVRCAGSAKQRRANTRETVSLHQRHGVSSAQSPR